MIHNALKFTQINLIQINKAIKETKIKLGSIKKHNLSNK